MVQYLQLHSNNLCGDKTEKETDSKVGVLKLRKGLAPKSAGRGVGLGVTPGSG